MKDNKQGQEQEEEDVDDGDKILYGGVTFALTGAPREEAPEEYPKLDYKLRKEKIKKLLPVTTQKEIARRCGVSYVTIWSDIKRMKKTGEYWEWLDHEFFRLYRTGDVSDDTKFRELGKLMRKTMKERLEVKSEAEVKHKIEEQKESRELLREYDESIREFREQFGMADDKKDDNR